MYADFLLAALHHGLAFSLAALLAVELALLRTGVKGSEVARLARVDGAYGAAAGGLLLVGVARVVFGAKGWDYYLWNPTFWAKIGVFGLIGLLSVPPTLRILRWRRARLDDGERIPPDEVSALRFYVRMELAGVAIVLVLAAALARGVWD
jgi:putative membrane protein